MSSALHPDGKLNPHHTVANDSGNDNILDLIEQRQISRRGFLKTSLGTTAGATAMAVLGTNIVDGLTNYAHAAGGSPSPVGGIGFTAVPANIVPMTDGVTVPAGYTAKVLISWGDSLTAAAHWDSNGAMDEATQLRTWGANTDGMHLFPFPKAGASGLGNERGLLVTNHEYCDPGLVCNTITYGTDVITPAMVNAQLAAHGISVVEIQKKSGNWSVKRPSGFNRRITGNTPCKISGPATGHEMMKTAADPTGMNVLGTLNNCAHGYTPWGTYLTCEENFNGYFGFRIPELDANFVASPSRVYSSAERSAYAAQVPVEFRRYGIGLPVFDSEGKFTGVYDFGYRWSEADSRFDANSNRNEANRFGWVVEIDPWNPNATPIKRTALGRMKHEGAWVVVGSDNTVAVYQGDDERNEYLYKFVCAQKYNAKNRAANRDLLDSGILYVAKFNSDGSGVWLPLVHGQNGLTPANGFNSQAEVLIKSRQAADRLGATMMDRPEWIAAHPTTREMYMTLTNNSRRGNTPASINKVDGTSNAASANPPVDAANPRPDNDFGHIIRWRENMGNVQATGFAWDIFVQCGDTATAKVLDTTPPGNNYNPAGHDGYVGNINGDDYGAPDGLWFDNDGRLWIQTDQIGNATGDWVNIGGNVMMCADPHTGETKRFLTSPRNCEVTGVINTPDGKTMFVGIQHPGESWEDPLVSPDVTSFTANSTWPDSGFNGPTTFTGPTPAKPRSSVVVITKDDGGVIGT